MTTTAHAMIATDATTAPSPHKPASVAPLVDDEHLAHGTLALVCDGADPVMNAVLCVCPAEQVWETLQCDPDRSVDGILALALPNARQRKEFESDPRRTVAWRTHIRGWVNRAAGLPRNLDDLWERLTDSGALHIVIPSDRLWPQRVEDLGLSQEFPDPTCLWVRGDPACLTACAAPLAIVGSREADAYGLSMARQAAIAAAKAGHTIISGGAMGIDAAAHRAAVETAPASTIAVMAGGLNHTGPARNLGLFDDIIASGGALISEVAPDTPPMSWRFLIRNRLIAALSHTVLVAQARYRSGALNTASHAARLNRVVLAMPGDADRAGNAGCNDLIYQGKAILLPDPRNVLDMLPDSHEHHKVPGERTNPNRRTAPNPGMGQGESSTPDGFPLPSQTANDEPLPGLFPDPDEEPIPNASANASVRSNTGSNAGANANTATHSTRPADSVSSSGGGERTLDDEIIRSVRTLRSSHRTTDIGSIQARLQRHGIAVTCRRLAVRLGALEMDGRVLRHADGTFAALE